MIQVSECDDEIPPLIKLIEIFETPLGLVRMCSVTEMRTELFLLSSWFPQSSHINTYSSQGTFPCKITTSTFNTES